MKKRNFGLDIIRAMAILLVLINHSINFVNILGTTFIGDLCGIYGVELFFVLSGFLIGQIIFRDVLPDISSRRIKTFYKRRWLRTLPLYYTILILLTVPLFFFEKTHTFPLFHFLFIQNFFPDSLRFFSVSWSLSIEEWFYLLLPLALYLLRNKLQTPRNQLIFLLTSICIVITLRFFYISFTHTTYDDLRKIIPLRFDSLLIGVLLSWIKLNAKMIYKELQKPSRVMVILTALAMTLATQYVYDIHFKLDTSRFTKVIGLAFTSAVLASLLPWFEESNIVNSFIAGRVYLYKTITNLSILSYSLYLVHLVIFDVIKSTFPNKFPSLVLLPIALAITFFISQLTYRYIEVPWIKRREKF